MPPVDKAHTGLFVGENPKRNTSKFYLITSEELFLSCSTVLKCFLTTMVESWRKAKPLLRCVCLSLMRRMLDGDKVAKGARADKIDSREVWGPRFLRIRAVVEDNVKEMSRQQKYYLGIWYKMEAKLSVNQMIYCHWQRPTAVLPGSCWQWVQRNCTV